MFLLVVVYLFVLSNQMVGAIPEIIVETPFYLRARMQDFQSASIQFEIDLSSGQRTCQMYKFTIRRNQEYPYSMPEQNLTFWRNSLELKHLAAGRYRICAIICSEQLREDNKKNNRTTPITTCLIFDAFRPHFLILTLYFLVVTLLIFSQIIFSLRKRKFKARIKMALIEVENTLQKWRSAQTQSEITDHTQSYSILQSLVTLPASPTEHSMPPLIHTTDDKQPTSSSHPIIFHLELPSE
jgi:hypothetical protein